MREKRKRTATSNTKGLATGEKLNRNRLLAESDIRWNWIGSEAKQVNDITDVHRLRASGLSFTKKKRPHPSLISRDLDIKFEHLQSSQLSESTVTAGNLDSDFIVVSDDDDEPQCSKKYCKENPFCLNHLGQEKWVDTAKAEEAYLETRFKGKNPTVDSREEKTPVGLKNLGATCYANAFLQVWFQDLAFRSGVYKCQPLNKQNFKESPIFHLQVTFAALQEGNKAVYNPVKLVESLRLRTTEQQDAQEFSKLFMSHLDSEFRKQPRTELQSLLSDQFEGKIVNAVVCDKCKNRSERETPFLELEVNLERTGVLEDRIASILAPERLEGDNRYLCSICEDLQDATRYTEIRSLPPVLHISLLRFVYDLTTFERKKSKLPLKFPPYLNMSPFLQSQDPHVMECDPSPGTMYELRGVLLHKGASAYHGHYEAQVFNEDSQKWYQFNDDIVTPLNSFYRKDNSDGNNKNGESEKAVKRIKRGAKARRVEDSDIEEVTPSPQPNELNGNGTRRLVSRDAYMLVYARKDQKRPTKLDIVPPPDAKAIVQTANEEHDKACSDYKVKEDAARADFAKARSMVLDIVQSWAISELSDDDLIISRLALEKWLTHWFSSPSTSDSKGTSDPEEPKNDTKSIDATHSQEKEKSSTPEAQRSPTPSSSSYIINNSNLLCRHKNLNPFMDKETKVLSQVAKGKLVDTGAKLEPDFSLKDLCNQCIDEGFIEKLYHLEHPQLVSEFNAICDPETDQDGFWISKSWVKDWQLVKPKMHVLYKNDSPPDSDGYDVKCEHGNLGLNTNSRRRISYEAVQLLQKLFPQWVPPAWDEKPCQVCTIEMNASKETKLEQRKRAETEKAIFGRLNDENVYGHQALKDGTCAVIPAIFVDDWRAWLVKPGEHLRPTSLDTSSMLCDHNKLVNDLTDKTDFDDDYAVVTLDEWETLQTYYPPSPLISISLVTELSEDGNEHKNIVTEIPCCFDCRTKNKLDFTWTIVTIILLRSEDPVPQHADRGPEPVSANNFGDSSLARSNGVRQSKRLRNGASVRRRTVKIFKDWTVKDLKIAIYKAFRIPTISQRLYHRGKELNTNNATIAEVEIIDKDTLYLKEIDEDAILVDSDLDNGQATKIPKKRDEGEAFKGTLLGGMSCPSSHPSTGEPDHLEDPTVAAMLSPVKHCPSCTFLNELTATQCEVCESFF